MPLEDLPHVDEHCADVAAPPAETWAAVLAVLRATFGSPRSGAIARALGCEPSGTSGWDRPGVGSTLPGFRVVTAQPPGRLVVAGSHRFSRYGLVVRIEGTPAGARVCAETRAAFPGPHGALYRLAVIGSGGHVVAVRRILRAVARSAERPAVPDTPS